MWLFKGKAGPTTEGEGQDVAAKGVHVVAIDESRDAEHAFQWAADNLPKGDRFILVNGVFAFPRQGEAINPLVELFPSTSPKEFEEYTRLQNNYQTKLFDYYREKCNTAKRDCTFLSVKYKGSGDLGERVCNVASEADAKSVVCGSRGLRFIDRIRLGSVSNSIVQQCQCSVIVTKEKPKEKEERQQLQPPSPKPNSVLSTQDRRRRASPHEAPMHK